MTKSSNHLEETLSNQVQSQIEDILLNAGKFNADVEGILAPYRKVPETRIDLQRLEHLFYRFHAVAKKLQKRQRDGKKPFYIVDEYDVQDLLHALLKIDFEDIRAEEYCPSYAGTSTRMDFFLRKEEVAIEAKIATKTHRTNKIREELILDKEYYQKRNDVKTLFCLVYDPYEVIDNIDGFEHDLYEKNEKYEVRVFVVPKR
jgi:hypothetical protein